MSPKPQHINLTFADGRVSKIDEDVHKLILEFQREIKSAKSTLPFFWDLSSSLKKYSENLLLHKVTVVRPQVHLEGKNHGSKNNSLPSFDAKP